MTRNRNRSDWFDLARKYDTAKAEAEPQHIVDRVREDNEMARAMRAEQADLTEQARTTALGYVMQAVATLMEAPAPDADVLAALDVVVDLLSGKG